MSRDREKYEHAIIHEFRESCCKEAEMEFDRCVACLKRRRQNGPVRTKAKYKRDNQKFDQLIIIIR